MNLQRDSFLILLKQWVVSLEYDQRFKSIEALDLGIYLSNTILLSLPKSDLEGQRSLTLGSPKIKFNVFQIKTRSYRHKKLSFIQNTIFNHNPFCVQVGISNCRTIYYFFF